LSLTNLSLRKTKFHVHTASKTVKRLKMSVVRTWIVVFGLWHQQSSWRTCSLHPHDAPNTGRHGNRV